MEAKFGETEISALLQKVRIFNKDIGVYQLHAITESFDYTIKLSNGKIIFKIEELQDDGKNALSPDQLIRIAERFIPTMQGNAKSVSQQENSNSHIVPKKKKNMGKVLLGLIILAVIIIIAVILNSLHFKSGSSNSDASYETKVMSVKETEEAYPANFLVASGTYNENFWGDAMKIHGSVTNKATVANYKDVVVEVIFYSETETELNRERYTIFDFFTSHSTKTFELKIERPVACKKLGWNVVSAIPY